MKLVIIFTALLYLEASWRGCSFGSFGQQSSCHS